MIADITALALMLDVIVYPTNEGGVVMFRRGYAAGTWIQVPPDKLDQAQALLGKYFATP